MGRESFHVTHSMTSERCLPACADTQTGLPAAIKALWSMDRDSTGQAPLWLLGDPPPVLSRPAGPYRRGENTRTARYDSPLLLACVYAQAGRMDGFPVVKDPLSRPAA